MMRLLLIRHGKAKQGSSDGEDASRELTEAGRRALAASLPYELELAGNLHDAMIMTSPAVRSQQTARLVSDCIGFDKATRRKRTVSCDALYSQDVDAFMGILGRLDDELTGPLIVVGHSPFMDDLLQRLTGDRIRFGKGAVAAIDLHAAQSDATGADGTEAGDTAGATARAGIEGELAWFVEGPCDERWRTLVRMEHTIAEAADDARRCMDDYLAEPADPESLHAFRVSLRSLRSLLAFVSAYRPRRFQSDRDDDVSNQLRDVMLETSHLRELDMLSELVAERYGEQSSLFSLCRARRDAESDRLLAYLAAHHQEIDELLMRAGKVSWRKQIERVGRASDEMEGDISRLRDRVLERGRHCDLNDAEATHTLRKKVKEVCYVTSRFSDTAEPADMKKLKDDLGALCDARVNRDIAKRWSLEPLDPISASQLASFDAAQLEVIEELRVLIADELGIQEDDLWAEGAVTDEDGQKAGL